MFHLVDGLVPGMFAEHGIAPILAHFRMNEVLIDADEFLAQYLVNTLTTSQFPFIARSPRLQCYLNLIQQSRKHKSKGSRGGAKF